MYPSESDSPTEGYIRMCTQYNWWRTLNIILFNFNYKLYSFKNFPVLIVLNDMTRQICHINGHLFLRKYKSMMFHSFKGLYTWVHGFNFMLPSNLLVLPQSDSMKVCFFLLRYGTLKIWANVNWPVTWCVTLTNQRQVSCFVFFWKDKENETSYMIL